MNLLRKSIQLIMVGLLIIVLIYIFPIRIFASNLNIKNTNMVNAAVILYSFDDPFMLEVKQSLEEIQNENKDKIKFTFYDGKNNITIQNEILDTILQSNVDLIMGNLVDVDESIVEDVINRVKAKNIPIVLLDISPQIVSKVSRSYKRASFIAPDSKDAGIAQGKILVDLWNTNKSVLDKNNDNILQYILMQGEAGSPTAIDRSLYSISTINNSGIKTEQLARVNDNWSRELARSSMESLLLRYAGKIEAIISNNDAMAIGAIETLQKYGYNKGDKTKNIVVIGFDALTQAKALIDKGFMAGTVIQDPKVLAQTFYIVGMNLVQNLNPTENTNYKIVNGEIIIPYPYSPYISKSNT